MLVCILKNNVIKMFFKNLFILIKYFFTLFLINIKFLQICKLQLHKNLRFMF